MPQDWKEQRFWNVVRGHKRHDSGCYDQWYLAYVPPPLSRFLKLRINLLKAQISQLEPPKTRGGFRKGGGELRPNTTDRGRRSVDQHAVRPTVAITTSGAATFSGTVALSGGVTASSTLDLTAAKLTGASPIVFDGATPDSHTVTLALAGDPSASTTVTLPLETGAVYRCTVRSSPPSVSAWSRPFFSRY